MHKHIIQHSMSEGRKEILDRRPRWPPFLSSDDSDDFIFRASVLPILSKQPPPPQKRGWKAQPVELAR